MKKINQNAEKFTSNMNKILIAEDDASARKFLELLLDSWGYHGLAFNQLHNDAAENVG